MNKKKVKRKLDEIMDFSGVEKSINTPVIRYSSGMYVRLGFAVAENGKAKVKRLGINNHFYSTVGSHTLYKRMDWLLMELLVM